MMDESTDWILGQLVNHDMLSSEEEREIATERNAAFNRLKDRLLSYPYSWQYFLEKRESYLSHNYTLARFCEAYGSNSFDTKLGHARIDSAFTKLGIYALQKDAASIQQLFRELDISQDAILDLWFSINSLPYDATQVGYKEKDRCERDYNRYIEERNKLVSKNYRLVVQVAHAYRRSGVPFEDLVQEGNVGLIRAAAKFQPDIGKFSTYVTWWIHQSINRFLQDRNVTLRAPQYVQRVASKLHRIQEFLAKEYGREPTAQEISDFAEIPMEIFHELYQVTTRPRSLEEIVSKPRTIAYDTGITLKDLIPSETDVEAEVDSLLEHARIVKALFILPGRERVILERRFGLNGRKEVPLEEIAKSYSLSRERIRQIEGKAINKVRAYLLKENKDD